MLAMRIFKLIDPSSGEVGVMMCPITRIVVATDISDFVRRAESCAALLAQEFRRRPAMCWWWSRPALRRLAPDRLPPFLPSLTGG